MNSRPDYWRTTRWQIAQLIILIDLAMFLGPAFVVYRWATSAPSQLTDDIVIRVAWAVGLVPAVASFVLAVRVFKAGDKASWRATGWAAGLFLVSVLLIGISSVIRYKH